MSGGCGTPSPGRWWSAGAVAVALLGAPAVGPKPVVGPFHPGLGAQEVPGASLDTRIREGRGRVAFLVPIREGVEVCDRGIRTGQGRGWTRWRGDGGSQRCSTGEAVVVLDVRNGEVRDLDLEPWTGASGGADAPGRVSAREAADALLRIVDEDGARKEAREQAMMAANLLEGVEVWPSLLDVARDRSRSRGLRKAALFWVGQAAAERVADDLEEVALADDEEQEIRDAAVFALSQRPAEQAVPALMDVARTAPHGPTRRSALFWLAQHDDPRVVPFFEEILAGG